METQREIEKHMTMKDIACYWILLSVLWATKSLWREKLHDLTSFRNRILRAAQENLQRQKWQYATILSCAHLYYWFLNLKWKPWGSQILIMILIFLTGEYTWIGGKICPGWYKHEWHRNAPRSLVSFILFLVMPTLFLSLKERGWCDTRISLLWLCVCF